MKIFAETETLILREILPTDVEGMYELDADPEVHKYLGNKRVTSKEQTVDMIKFIRQQYIDNGIGRWSIIDKKSHEFLGWTGLKFVTDKTNRHRNYYDLGYPTEAVTVSLPEAPPLPKPLNRRQYAQCLYSPFLSMFLQPTRSGHWKRNRE